MKKSITCALLVMLWADSDTYIQLRWGNLVVRFHVEPASNQS